MGMQINNSILVFFNSQMDGHSCVDSWIQLPIEDDIVFEIRRRRNLPSLKVHVSDAYHYDLADFLSRPGPIGVGDYILIARPEADFDPSLVPIARKEAIGIGKFKHFKGALNYANIWEYVGPQN